MGVVYEGVWVALVFFINDLIAVVLPDVHRVSFAQEKRSIVMKKTSNASGIMNICAFILHGFWF